jgi:hypothetical protein
MPVDQIETGYLGGNIAALLPAASAIFKWGPAFRATISSYLPGPTA